jgi:hypothetical protein
MTDSVACAFTILYDSPFSMDCSTAMRECQLPGVSEKIAAYHDECRKWGRVRGWCGHQGSAHLLLYQRREPLASSIHISRSTHKIDYGAP